MSTPSPWGITGAQNVINGWTETVCMYCTYDSANGFSIQQDNWQLSQQPLDCSSQIVDATTVLGSVTVPYDSTVTAFVN